MWSAQPTRIQRPSFSSSCALALVVLAVGAVYGDAVAAGDEADYLVARHGGAALGELDEAVVQALDQDAVDGLLRAGGALFGLLGYLVEDGLLLRLADARELVLDAVDAPHGGLAAVAYGGEELVQAGHGELLEYLRQHLLVRDVGHREAAAAAARRRTCRARAGCSPRAAPS